MLCTVIAVEDFNVLIAYVTDFIQSLGCDYLLQYKFIGLGEMFNKIVGVLVAVHYA